MRWWTSSSTRRALEGGLAAGSRGMGEGTRTGCLGGNALEDVVDKRVENGHGLVGDTSVRVDLLEDWVRT